MNQQNYIGRFAPSPTGHLHYGSLVAATASYLQAKHHQGQWLLRIEDIDPPREMDGATEDIITTLERYQFEWDETPLYQSSRIPEYQAVIKNLFKQDLVYACECSRKDLKDEAHKSALGKHYPGHCSDKHLNINNTDYNLRIRVEDKTIRFRDGLYGELKHNLSKEIGDFIIYRKFDLPSYALAVTIDDAYQGVTEIVRGYDLLAFTPIQIFLCEKLNTFIPNFLHIPILVNQQGQKLSKQTKAKAVPKENCGSILVQALNDLGQCVPSSLNHQALPQLWEWAIENWNVKKIPMTTQITYRP